jgi:hypothetical protein
MARKLDYRWNLRQVMASRDMFQTTDLAPLLAERGIDLSSSQVYRLFTERPERLSLKVLMADPVGIIVAMISDSEPTLDRAIIEEAVISVAGGRAKRRKLAQALARRPAILADGRSPRAAGRRGPAGRAAGDGRPGGVWA